jgi:hypothetical protein
MSRALGFKVIDSLEKSRLDYNSPLNVYKETLQD